MMNRAGRRLMRAYLKSVGVTDDEIMEHPEHGLCLAATAVDKMIAAETDADTRTDMRAIADQHMITVTHDTIH